MIAETTRLAACTLRRLVLAFFCLSIALPVSAAPSEETLTTAWYVEPDAEMTPELTLKEHQIFYRARIYPAYGYALDDPLPITDTKRKSGPITELVGVSQDRRIGCENRRQAKTRREKLIFEFTDFIYQCYVDSDGDGAFEGRFPVSVNSEQDSGQGYIGSFPMILLEGTFSAEVTSIAPVRYHTIPGKSFTQPTFLYYGFNEHHSLVKEFSIGMLIEEKDRTIGNLNDGEYGYLSFALKDKDIPVNLPLPGRYYRVEELADGKLTVRLVSESGNNVVCVGFRCQF